MPRTYRIRVSDRLGPALCRSFVGMRAVVIPRQTVIEGWLSAEEFLTLLQRVDQVGVQVLYVECAAGDCLTAEAQPGHSRRIIPRG
jgi:hypothetical protein